jgi:hypothetical protein
LQDSTLALSNTLWNGSARFTMMRDHLRSPGALQGLVILEARKDDELNSSWERRVEKILLKVPEPMRAKVRGLDEQALRAAVDSGSLGNYIKNVLSQCSFCFKCKRT